MDTTENGMKSGQTAKETAGGASHDPETAEDADVATGNIGAAGNADGGQRSTEGANAREDAERAWRAVYEPVERAIVEEHERRVASRVRRQKERAEEERRAKGDLLEATEGRSAVWERESRTMDDVWAVGDSWILGHLVRAVRKEATRLIDRLRHAERRPTYYEAENARRRALAEERRRIRRRTTTNPCPTREQILDGWLHRSDSHEAAIRFGSLLMDLECHLDNSLVFDDDGVIAGRRGGVKRWLQENVPALYLRYTTVMRFKAAAQKLRQIAELRDPVPAAVIVDLPCENEEADEMRLRSGRNRAADASASRDGTEGMEPPCERDRIDPAADVDRRVKDADVANVGVEDMGLRCGRDRIARARAVWREVVAGIGSTPTALMARIDALLDPRRTAEEGGMLAEWRERHGAEVAARTKPQAGAPPGWPTPPAPSPRHRTA